MTGTPQGATPFTRSLINPRRAEAAAAPLSRLGLEIAAHRGDSAHAPENTLAAFHRAVAAGVPWIELDVHPSQDGALMVLHDDTVDRTTNGRGAVGDLASDALRRLDAGSWFAPAFAREKIPFLSEVMDLVGPTGIRVNTWTVDDPAAGASLSAMGVDKICTNCPARMQAAAVCWRRR